jgi:hypothetical protein
MKQTRKRAESSALSWLVFTDSDIQDARRFIDNLDTSDATVDTLGLGVVLESLSEFFFPATSTLHRNIRYQIFIPALVWFLQQQKNILDARVGLRKIEYELQRALVAGGETKGVIGLTRKEALKYWPSLLYWNATNKLQMLRKGDGYSMDEVFRILQERGQRVVNDDGEAESSMLVDATKSISFDKELAAIAEALFTKKTGRLRQPVTFQLTKAEAAYLKNKFQSLFPSSLTFYLLNQTSTALGRIDSLFELTSTPRRELNELVRQAELFSRFAMGATYAYRWALCEHLRAHAPNSTVQKDRAASRDHAEAHFTRWRNDSSKVLDWSYSDLTDAAKALGVALADENLEELQKEVLEAARSRGTSRQALDRLKKFIRNHEFRIKRNSSRFENANISIPRNVFEKEFGGYRLFDYRWSAVARSNALAIVGALEGRV